MLLEKQSNVSHQFPLPVDVADESTRVTDVSGETVALVVASTNVADAGSAAGTIVFGRLANGGILNSTKSRIGHHNDTSFSWTTGMIFTSLVAFPYLQYERAVHRGDSRADALAEAFANFTNGQYAIEHRTKLIVGKKATTGTSDTAAYSYSSVATPVSSTGVEGMVQGNIAHDTADSGNPVKIGGKALSTNPTAVTTGDRVNALFDLLGKQVVRLNAVRELEVHQHTEIVSSGAETTILAAGAAGVFHDITHIIITNQTATATNVTIKDSTAGTTQMVIALDASGGGISSFPVPVKQTTAANNWTATSSSAAVTLDIFIQAVKNV